MKISVIQYNYKEPFTKDQVPRFIGRDKVDEYGRGWVSPKFQEIEMPPEQLSDYLKNNIVWSPFLFEGGVRHSDNNKKYIDCIAFDYDEGSLTWEEIVERMMQIEYFGWIKNFQVIFAGSPRNSVEVHKYRIVIPFKKSFKIDNYSKMYQKIVDDMKEVGVVLDSVKDLARIFYSVDFCEIHTTSDNILPDFKIISNVIKRSIKEKPKFKTGRATKRSFDNNRDIEGFYKNSVNFQEKVQKINTSQHRGKDQYGLMNYLKACGFTKADFEEFVSNHNEIDWEMNDLTRTLNHNMKSW